MYTVESFDSETGWYEIGASADPDHAFAIAEELAGEKLSFHPYIFQEGDGQLSAPDTHGCLYRIIRVEDEHE